MEQPVCVKGPVIKGFGRGGKQLGIPTANLPIAPDDPVIAHLDTGIYFGWVALRGRVFKGVLSIGYNPYFHNKEKSLEVHLLHEFDSDFYGETLNVLILGYIRPESNFASLEDLIAAIRNDIRIASERLDEEPFRSQAQHPFLQQTTTSTE